MGETVGDYAVFHLSISWSFQRYSRLKSKVFRNGEKFWAIFAHPQNFRGADPHKLYPNYHTQLMARHVEKFFCGYSHWPQS